jgi:hypothetical protein
MVTLVCCKRLVKNAKNRRNFIFWNMNHNKTHASLVVLNSYQFFSNHKNAKKLKITSQRNYLNIIVGQAYIKDRNQKHFSLLIAVVQHRET